MKQNAPLPRGIRNCNPLNIRIGNTWLGERDNPDDTEFEQFVSMVYGLRAGFIILRRYIRRYHLNTVQLIISRWAPRSENDTSAYVSTVCAKTGLQPDEPIDYADQEAMTKLVSAMCLVECGQPVEMDKIITAYRMT